MRVTLAIWGVISFLKLCLGLESIYPKVFFQLVRFPSCINWLISLGVTLAHFFGCHLLSSYLRVGQLDSLSEQILRAKLCGSLLLIGSTRDWPGGNFNFHLKGIGSLCWRALDGASLFISCPCSLSQLASLIILRKSWETFFRPIMRPVPH